MYLKLFVIKLQTLQGLEVKKLYSFTSLRLGLKVDLNIRNQFKIKIIKNMNVKKKDLSIEFITCKRLIKLCKQVKV